MTATWLCSSRHQRRCPMTHESELALGLVLAKRKWQSDGILAASLRRPCLLLFCHVDSDCHHENKPGLTCRKMKNHKVPNRVTADEATLDWQASASWPGDHRGMNKPSWDQLTTQPSCRPLRNKTQLSCNSSMLVWFVMQQLLTNTARYS